MEIIQQIAVKAVEEIFESVKGTGLSDIGKTIKALTPVVSRTVLSILTAFLEKMDEDLVTGAKALRREDGITVKERNVSRTWLTELGELTYKRTYFRLRDGSFVYLLDHIIGVESYERISKELVADILQAATVKSYQQAIDSTKQEISRQTVHNRLVALDDLVTGNYELTDDEVITIMRSALALGLTGFIQGLTSLSDDVAPIRPFLNFCASVQQDGDEDNIYAYQQLLSQPQSEENFNAAMDQIMGSCMPGEELDELYTKFKGSTAVDSSYPQMKEKVESLYSIFKNDETPDRQRLAQWALTYFFDDEDIIHDDVSGLGLIDDMTIIDYATRLLQS